MMTVARGCESFARSEEVPRLIEETPFELATIRLLEGERNCKEKYNVKDRFPYLIKA